ncbi:MAG: metal ABC transporter permease [Candidatus Ranarchaeia archaeon]
MATLFDFLNALSYPFMQRALISSLIIGIICSMVGVFVLLRGIVFLGEAIAHSAFAGAALALLLAIDPLLTIMVFAVMSAIGIGYVNEKQLMQREVIVGIVFSFFMGLAVLFIGLLPVFNTDVTSILFGNILLISFTNYTLLLIFGFAVFFVVAAIKKELFFMTFDSEAAQVTGIPVRFLNYLFLVVVSLTISVSLRAIGAILVFAMIITPAASAYQLTFKLNKLLGISMIFGVTSTIAGLYLSYILDAPSGSTIVILATTIFAFCFLLSPKRRTAGKSVLECPYCKDSVLSSEGCQNPECPSYGLPHQHDDTRIALRVQDLPVTRTTIHGHDDETLTQKNRDETYENN